LPSQPKKSGKRPKNPNAALKYAGMAFQMMVFIGLGIFIGKKLDAYLGLESPLMTLLCALLALGMTLYLIVKDVSKNG